MLVRNVPVRRSRSPMASRLSLRSSTSFAPITVSIAGSAALALRAIDDDVPYTPAWQEQITGVSAPTRHRGRPRIRRQCGKDQWPLDGDHRRGH